MSADEREADQDCSHHDDNHQEDTCGYHAKSIASGYFARVRVPKFNAGTRLAKLQTHARAAVDWKRGVSRGLEMTARITCSYFGSRMCLRCT
jgi:hypothetical protein